MSPGDAWAGGSVENRSHFDAIVVGSGAAGGVAATELCAAGLKVAVLEAGWNGQEGVHPLTGGLAAMARLFEAVGAETRLPPVLGRAGERAFRLLGRVRQPVQSRCFAWAMAPGVLVDDRHCAYRTDEDSEFLWFRSRQLGGRMLVPGHGRQYYRLAGLGRSDPASAETGWPIDLEDLEPWYCRIETRLQLKGGAPEAGPLSCALSEVLEPTGSEQMIMDRIRKSLPGLSPRLGNFAPPAQWLDAAACTGRLTCQPGAVVRRVLRSDAGSVKGVEWFDIRSGESRTAHAPIVFLCASSIESTRILLASRADGNAPAIGTGSSSLGCYLMDHAVMSGTGYRTRLEGIEPGQDVPGRSVYVPPQEGGDRIGFQVHIHPRPDGGARLDIVSFAEMLPDADNRVTLDPVRRDRYGMPIPVIRFNFSQGQHALAQRQAKIIRQMADDFELGDVVVNDRLSPGGSSIHESGTARMGADPESSVVDSNNECWDIRGLYVTDGACFPRQHVHNPTLTIMALTARAAAHAAGRRA